jgi:hypothetical protein
VTRKRRQRAAVEARDGLACWFCDRETPEDDRVLARVVPKAQGGTIAQVNLRLAHGWCNRMRNLTPEERDALVDDGESVYVTRHAAQRFRQRARPTTSLAAARVELRELLCDAEESTCPDWVWGNADRADAWLIIESGVGRRRSVHAHGRRMPVRNDRPDSREPVPAAARGGIDRPMIVFPPSGPVQVELLWLGPSEREGDNRRTDPTRPFTVRAGSFLRVGVGGYWGLVAIEASRPRPPQRGLASP